MDERPLDLAVLRTFSPLDGLKAENLHALARKTHIRELAAGRVLFKEGDTDKRTFYLVAGSVELRADDKTHRHDSRRHPRGARGARSRAAAKIHRARGDRYRIHRDRQRSARCAADLGSDRPVRSGRAARRRPRRHRRLDDDAAADQGVSPHSAGEHPGHFHAHAAHQLPRRRCRHQAGHRGRLFLRGGRRQMRRDARDAAEQGRHQARRTGARRQLRRGSADCRGEAQCHRHHVHRRHADASRQE